MKRVFYWLLLLVSIVLIASSCADDSSSSSTGSSTTSSSSGDSSDNSTSTSDNSSSSSVTPIVSAGNSHTCAILDNASVKCWGYNGQGQLGIDSAVNTGDNSSEMASLTGINLGAGRTATAITAGGNHT